MLFNFLSLRATQVVLAAGLAVVPTYAQHPPALQGHDWKASWITSADAPPHGPSVLHFRKLFAVTASPIHFVVHISADNQFQLRVNGQPVATGPAHSNLEHWKYETYDIAPLLHIGKNIIAATVWNFGEASPLRQISNRTGLVVDGDTDKEAPVRTDNTWEVEDEPGITIVPKPPFLMNSYYVAPPGERVDGPVFDWTWDQLPAAGTPSAWKAAQAIASAAARGTAFNDTNWQLVPDLLPPMEMTDQAPGRIVRQSGVIESSSSMSVSAHTNASLLIDQGALTTAYPQLTLAKGKGSIVTVHYAEALYDAKGDKGNRNEINEKHIDGLFDEILPEGVSRRTYIPLEWRTWRYLQIDIKTGDEALELEPVRSIFTAYPFKQAGHFESDDPSLTRLWDTGWRTARVCAHDTYMDTPYWERLQYAGDTRIEMLLSYAIAGDDRLARQGIEAFHNSTTSEGIPLSRYPSSLFQSIPGFSMYWIGMVHDYWMYRSDSEFVRAQLPVVRSTIAWFIDKQNANGLIGRLPWWPFVDWSDGFDRGFPPQDADGDSAVLSLQLVEALRYASELENALGNADLGRLDSGKADEIAAAVYKLCWSDKEGLLADTPEKSHFSQHANAYAVWLDVIPEIDQKKVMNRIFSVTDPAFISDRPVPVMSKASYYYRFYLSRALLHAGMGDEYLETLGPWKKMIANGLTTWAEQPEPSRSDSHAWSAHPNFDLLTVVAGISPAGPGFGSVRVQPHLGNLKHLSAAMASPRGNIEVQFEVRKKGVDAVVTLPDGLDGSLIWNGQTTHLQSGTQHLRLDPDAENITR
jgi:alpha-L-rhamnosidase